LNPKPHLILGAVGIGKQRRGSETQAALPCGVIISEGALQGELCAVIKKVKSKIWVLRTFTQTVVKLSVEEVDVRQPVYVQYSRVTERVKISATLFLIDEDGQEAFKTVSLSNPIKLRLEESDFRNTAALTAPFA